MTTSSYFVRQNQARFNTTKLIFLYILGILLVPILFAFIYFLFTKDQYANIPNQDIWKTYLSTYGWTTLLTSIPVFLGSLYYYNAYSQPGDKIARSLGAHNINEYEENENLIKLNNVVEELSIASGYPKPQIFVLDDPSINAFAAGNSKKNAVICVNTGTLDNLDREELSGVLAHEFSHLVNEDTKINIRISSLIGGFGVLTVIGQILIRAASSSSRSSRSKNNGTAGILLIGLVVILLGLCWSWYSKIIAAAVSRQREFLADATAVSYTRDDSIACALEKIRRQAIDHIKSSLSKEQYSNCNHMFFSGINETGLLDSHPNLDERIKRAREMSYTIDKYQKSDL